MTRKGYSWRRVCARDATGTTCAVVDEGFAPAEAQGAAAIVRGASVALLGSLLGGGLGFVFSVLMAHLLEQSDFGLLVLALNLLVGGAALGAAGVDYAVVRFVASAPDAGAKRGAMLTPLGLVLMLDTVVAVAVAVFAEPIAVDVLGQPGFVWPLRALALVLPLTVLAQVLSAALAGLEHARGELARKLVEQAGRIALAPIGLAVGLGVAGTVLGMAAAAAAAALVVGLLLLRSLPRGGRTQPIDPRRVVSFAWPQAVANIAGQVWEAANVVILAHVAGGEAVALYGAAIAIARLPALVYNSFAYRISPTIARLWEHGERAQLVTLLQTVTRWVSLIAVPLYAVAIAVPHPLLHVYGADYTAGALALALISLGSLFNSVTGPVETALIMTGRVKQEMAANVVCAAICTALSLVLTPRFGLTGAAGSMLVYSLVLNTTKSVLAWRGLGLVTVSRSLAGPLGAGAVAVALGLLLVEVGPLDHSLAGGAAAAVVLLCVYALLLLRVVGVTDDDRRVLGLALRPTR